MSLKTTTCLASLALAALIGVPVAMADDDGPLRVGACAEVYIDDGRVEEIETEPLRDCR